MLKPWQAKVWLEGSPGKSFHAKLMNKLIVDIKEGRFSPGTMLPGSRTLAKQLNVNRKTVQQVYEEMESQGWLLTKPRQGTFISNILPEKSLSKKNKTIVNSAYITKRASTLTKSLYRDALNLNDTALCSNDGVPDSRLIPYELLAKAYRRACINLSRYSKLGYGDPRGTIELRSSIQKMLSCDRFMNFDSTQICIVRGSQMGIYLASRVLDSTKGVMIVEETCYAPARAAFESNGFKVLKCKLDHHGLNIVDLEKLLVKHEIAGVYLTPHHQYPTTVCLPMTRRLALLELSKQHQFVVIEDDYDHEFHYEGSPIPPLASLPNSENVIHIGSMSKVFAPGLRLGYVVANESFIERAAQEIVLIDRQGNTISEYVLSDLMESGEVKRHIRKTRKEYRKRRDFAVNELNRVYENKVQFNIPTGGMAIWIDITKLVDVRKIESFKNEDSTFYFNDETKQTHIRFGFGALTNAEIAESINNLSQVFNHGE